MSKADPTFFDEESVFTTYNSHRQNPHNPNDTLEAPIMTELVGSVEGLDVLDIGCGNASYGRELLEKGCKSYLGIEGSRKMIEAAKTTLAGTKGRAIYTRVEAWHYPLNSFDLIVSRLVLHYLEDIDTAFSQFFEALKPNGRLVFSVEHPVITSHNSLLSGERRTNWTVDNYFATGRRTVSWLDSEVFKYHRTVEDYFLGLQKAGFLVESLRESRPDKTNFSSQTEYERRIRIPLFLFLTARKQEI